MSAMRLSLLLFVCACNNPPSEPDAALDAVPDALYSQCRPSGNCTDGPACGGVCCGPGEQCISGVCKCGQEPACTGGDTCQSGGPMLPAVCGSVRVGVHVGWP